MLTAYLDETGHESKEHVFIAGFVGNDKQWNALASAWKLALGKRKALHMSELRWSQVGRIEPLLARLGPLPLQCGLERVVSGVRVRDYENLVVGPIGEKLKKGYIAALFPLIIQILRWVPENDRVELVFEEQKQYQPVAEIVLAEVAGNSPDPCTLTSEGHSKLASWRFLPKGTTVLTEPADYFSYALGQLYKDRKSDRTRLCLPILGDETSTAIGAVMSRQQIRDTIQKMQQAVRLDAVFRAKFKPRNSEEMKMLRAAVERIVLSQEGSNEGKKTR